MADRFPTGNKPVSEGGFFQVDPRFVDLCPLGYGGNGIVYSATDSDCDKAVSIKKLSFTDRKSCKYALREIRLMRRLQHENIVTVYEILGPNGFGIDRNSNLNINELRTLYLVQELLDTDLYQLIQNQSFSEEHSKLFLYQLLRGLKYIHSANVVHRDLKPANLLVNVEDFVLKITDFGLARVVDSEYSHKGFLTDGVGTCWYRSPELILSPRDYTKAIDIWSVGCIFAEMVTKKPLFPGGNEMDQIGQILDALHFSDNEWNTLTQVLPQSVLRNRSKTPKSPLHQKLKECDPQALDLLVKLLHFKPEDRITAEEALCHPYLSKYSCPQDEPTVQRAFHIEHEVDELSPKTLRRMISEEAVTSNPVQVCGKQIQKPVCPKMGKQASTETNQGKQGTNANINREMEFEMEKIKVALEDIEILCVENKLADEITENIENIPFSKDIQVVVDLPDEENKKEQLSPKEEKITEKEKNSVDEKEDILVELRDLPNNKENSNTKNHGHKHIKRKSGSIKDKDRVNEERRAESPREMVEVKIKNKTNFQGNLDLPRMKYKGKDRMKKDKIENAKNEKMKKNENSKSFVNDMGRDFDSMYRLPTEHLTRRRNSRNERLLGSRKLHEEVNARLKLAERPRDKEKCFGAVGGNMSLSLDCKDDVLGVTKDYQGQRSRSSSGSSETSQEESPSNDEPFHRRFEH